MKIFPLLLFPFLAHASVSHEIPSFHFRRVLEPVGLEGYDLSCAASETPKPEPDCKLTFVVGNEQVKWIKIEFSVARDIVSAFFESLRPQEIRIPLEKKTAKVQFQPGAAFYWSGAFGKKVTTGKFEKKTLSSDEEAERLRVLLSLEYAFFNEVNG